MRTTSTRYGLPVGNQRLPDPGQRFDPGPGYERKLHYIPLMAANRREERPKHARASSMAVKSMKSKPVPNPK